MADYNLYDLLITPDHSQEGGSLTGVSGHAKTTAVRFIKENKWQGQGHNT